MSYYIRVLATSDAEVPVARLRERLQEEGLDARLDADEDDPDGWSELLLAHPDGDWPIADIQKDLVRPGELGEEELEQFAEEVEAGRPESAARWLTGFLPKVRTIYAFQVLSGADRDDGWEAIHAVQDELHARAGGILQADGEGFTNEEGDHILWQFHDGVEGSRTMAVLGDDGHWVRFEMDLGDPEQRAAFLDGRVPPGAKRP